MYFSCSGQFNDATYDGINSGNPTNNGKKTIGTHLVEPLCEHNPLPIPFIAFIEVNESLFFPIEEMFIFILAAQKHFYGCMTTNNII